MTLNKMKNSKHCPKLHDDFCGGKVIFILGDSKGWTVYTRVYGNAGEDHGQQHHRIDADGTITSGPKPRGKHITDHTQL